LFIFLFAVFKGSSITHLDLSIINGVKIDTKYWLGVMLVLRVD